MRLAAAATAVALTTTWLAWPAPPPPAEPEPAPVSVADRYRAADQIDRSTRDPIAEPSPATTPTEPPPPPPEPEIVPVAPPPETEQTPTAGLPPLLVAIRANESGGDYSAYNPTGCEGSGCYGAYQLHGAYADDWAARYGHPEAAGTPANQWPPATQDAVALGLFYSTNPDGTHWCSWTDYC